MARCAGQTARQCTVLTCVTAVAEAGGLFWYPALTLENPSSSVGSGCQDPRITPVGTGTRWVYDSSAGACVLPASSGPSCTSFSLRPANPYQHVRGRALGVQLGELCAFGPSDRYNGTGLTQTLDGEGSARDGTTK